MSGDGDDPLFNIEDFFSDGPTPSLPSPTHAASIEQPPSSTAAPTLPSPASIEQPPSNTAASIERPRWHQTLIPGVSTARTAGFSEAGPSGAAGTSRDAEISSAAQGQGRNVRSKLTAEASPSTIDVNAQGPAVGVDRNLGLVNDGRPNYLLAVSACLDVRKAKLSTIVSEFEKGGNVVVIVTGTAEKVIDLSSIQCLVFSNTKSWNYYNRFGIQLSDILSRWASNVVVFATANTMAKVSKCMDNNLLTMVTSVSRSKVYIVPSFPKSQWDTRTVKRVVAELRADGFTVREMMGRFPMATEIIEML